MTRTFAISARLPHGPASSLVAARAGTTLTEVLMSLLVMGIGVVGVAALFPISVLRSVDATRLTTAAAARYSVEGLIDATAVDPNHSDGIPGCASGALALDPDRNGDPAFNTLNGDPRTTREMYVVDPLGYWRGRQFGLSHAAASAFGDWPAADGARLPHFRFGAFGYVNQAYDPSVAFEPIGNPLALSAWASATEAFVSPTDQFTTVADGFATYAAPAGTTPASVTFPAAEADFSSFIVPPTMVDAVGLSMLQVTIFSADNRRSAVLGVNGPAHSAADLQAGRLYLVGTLPSWLTTTGRVLVESGEVRYSWMLTVRNQPFNGGRQARIDAAIFFRRPFGPDSETIYKINREAVANIADAQRRSEAREYSVSFVSTDTTGPLAPPDVAIGRWVFDPSNFRWYKVGRYEEAVAADDPSTTGVEDRKYVFRLEGVEPQGETFNRGMFMTGVIDVYPLIKTAYPLTDQ